HPNTAHSRSERCAGGRHHLHGRGAPRPNRREGPRRERPARKRHLVLLDGGHRLDHDDHDRANHHVLLDHHDERADHHVLLDHHHHDRADHHLPLDHHHPPTDHHHDLEHHHPHPDRPVHHLLLDHRDHLDPQPHDQLHHHDHISGGIVPVHDLEPDPDARCGVGERRGGGRGGREIPLRPPRRHHRPAVLQGVPEYRHA